jgi:hypothetical protein
LLHRNLRNARQRFSIPVQSKCQISDDIDIRIIGDWSRREQDARRLIVRLTQNVGDWL